MTKFDIHQRFIEQLAVELEGITEAAKNSIDVATNEEHQAKSKYDTFSLETSYLARGQALRVEELTEALERLRALPMLDFSDGKPVDFSALVHLEATDATVEVLFLAPVGGGEEITVDGEEIIIVTPSSPLGRAVMGKTLGERIEITLGGSARVLKVTAVS